MNGLSIKQLSRVTKTSSVSNPEQRYALIYTLMDKCEIMDKTDLLQQLGLLCGEFDTNDIRIIRIHKDINFESALAIAGAADMKYEYLQSYFDGDTTPYQALRELDLI